MAKTQALFKVRVLSFGYVTTSIWDLFQTVASVCFCFCFSFYFFFFFLIWLHLWHMEVPRPGVKLELQLPAYPIGTATRGLSRICDLRHSLWQLPDP